MMIKLFALYLTVLLESIHGLNSTTVTCLDTCVAAINREPHLQVYKSLKFWCIFVIFKRGHLLRSRDLSGFRFGG